MNPVENTGASPKVTAEDRARLHGLARMLRLEQGRARYLGYPEVERDCEVLAARLLDEYTSEQLARFRFGGIPRGGLIVLGMLTYFLGLDHRQLEEGFEAETLCVVDDSAFTGSRFARAMTSSPHRGEVIFAHLYSTRELRQAILTKEERVLACIAAHDLQDHTAELLTDGQDVETWRQAWEGRAGRRYWFGLTDLVAFPWSEPDRPLWNPVTERLESTWRFVAPERSLEHRARLAPPSTAAPQRRFRVSDGVVSGIFDDAVWLCRTDTEQVYVLHDTGAAAWRALAAYGSVDGAAEYMSHVYEADRAVLAGDLSGLADRLVEQGLLTRLDG